MYHQLNWQHEFAFHLCIRQNHYFTLHCFNKQINKAHHTSCKFLCESLFRFKIINCQSCPYMFFESFSETELFSELPHPASELQMCSDWILAKAEEAVLRQVIVSSFYIKRREETYQDFLVLLESPQNTKSHLHRIKSSLRHGIHIFIWTQCGQKLQPSFSFICFRISSTWNSQMPNGWHLVGV